MPDEIIIVDLSKIPADVLKKAKLVFKQTKWLSALKVENDNGKIAYELDGTINGSKDEVTVTITDVGKMVEYDVYLSDPTKTPTDVLEAVKKKFPNFELAESHRHCLGEDIKNQENGEYLYELLGKRGKFNVQARVSIGGEILEFVNEWDLTKNKVPQKVTDKLNEAKGDVFEADTVYAINVDNKIIGFKFSGKNPKAPKGLRKCFFVTIDGTRVERVEG
jgi:hypothetical protein